MFRDHSKGLIHRMQMDESLHEMRKLASLFGDPQKSMKVIHVAGTNGKGSVTLKVAKALSKMGYKTGQFTSPHINSFRERIQVNDQLIS
jgi:dihydrofolate synthase / folylpolyglutamate synthase